jgi:hypothetical protein
MAWIVHIVPLDPLAPILSKYVENSAFTQSDGQDSLLSSAVQIKSPHLFVGANVTGLFDGAGV